MLPPRDSKGKKSEEGKCHQRKSIRCKKGRKARNRKHTVKQIPYLNSNNCLICIVNHRTETMKRTHKHRRRQSSLGVL